MIRVVIPYHLRTLANVTGEVMLDVADPITQRSILDALEARYPMLRGTIRDHVTQQRRAFIRFSPASKTYPSTHPTTHSPPRSPPAPSPSSSSAPSPADKAVA
jgi:molybdopterin synthase sulfur carrier subunit